MKIRKEDLDPKPTASEQLLDWSGKRYRAYRASVKITAQDSLGLVIGKAILSLLGLLIMLLLSPFLVVGLIIAFAAVL